MPFENLLSVLKMSNIEISNLKTSKLKTSKRLSEIYILSPTFDCSKDFLKKLNTIRSVNNGISLHTEMRTDRIDAESAKLLKLAGFNTAEVGIQTLTRTVLANINRNSDPEQELKGMCFMRDAGIELKIGIIPGLPGETPESFRKSITRLTELGFAKNITLYPLMVLPGTAIREKALQHKISFQKRAPYFYLDGWGINSDDIKKITIDLERDSGYGYQIYSLPDFSLGEKGELVKSIYFDGRNPGAWPAGRYLELIESSCFDFHILLDEKADITPLNLFIQSLPTDVLYNFIFYCEKIIDEHRLISITENYMDGIISRMNIFNGFKAASPFRFYQVFKKNNNYRMAYEEYSFVDPVLFIDNDAVGETINFITDEGPENNYILIGKNLSGTAMEKLFTLYKDYPEMIAFMESDLQKDFYSQNKITQIDNGFKFRKIII